MHLQTFLSTCALALSANALLVPPTTGTKPTVGDSEFWDSAKAIMKAEPRKTISLPCTGCPIAQKDEKSATLTWSDSDAKTELPLEFVVEGKEIKMNGQAFYPPSRKTLNSPLFVNQVLAAGEESPNKAIYSGKIPISTGLEVHPSMTVATVHMANVAAGENPFVKTPMRRLTFEIIGLANQVVRVDSVELWVSQSDDNLTLFGLNTTPYTKHSTSEGDACTTVLCRVRASIREKLASWRAAAAARLGAASASCMRGIQRACGKLRLPVPRPHHGMKGHFGKPKGGIAKFAGDATLAPGGKNHPHGPFAEGGMRHGKGPQRGHGHHRHHHHGGAKHVMRVVGRFFRHVVLPIFIGVAAGMAVSGLGMLIGQAVVLLYLRTRRGGSYQAVEQTEGENRESFDELPKYEEAPEYEDAPAYEDEKKVEEEQK